jgi:uncharacterized protein YukE
MALIRIDPDVLRLAATGLAPTSGRLAQVQQDLQRARSSIEQVGDRSAASACSEALRGLALLVEIYAVAAAGLQRSLHQASGDYQAAEQVVIR